MTNVYPTHDEKPIDKQEDLISQFLAEGNTTAKEKRELDWLMNVQPSTPRLRHLVVKLTDWCYYEGYSDGEAGQQ